MDFLQAVTAALLVIAALGGTLLFLHRRGWVQFRGSATTARRMNVIERLPLTPQHSLHLVRVDGRTLLVSSGPGGSSMLVVEEVAR